MRVQEATCRFEENGIWPDNSHGSIRTDRQNREKEHRDVNLQKIAESSLNAGKKTVETMNQTTHEPLIVTQEAVDAYEKNTGFLESGRSWLKTGTGRS